MKVAHATFQEDNTTDVVIKDSDQVVNEVRNNMEETNNKTSESSSFPTLRSYFLPLTEVELGNPSVMHCGVRRLKGSLHHISIILSIEKEASYYIGRV